MDAIVDGQWGRGGVRASRRVSCQAADGGSIEIVLTGHAVSRFGERVRPALGEKALGDELEALIENFGRVLPHPPQWQAERSRQVADLYIELLDGVIVPVVKGRSGFYATTVLTRGGVSEKARASRNKRNRSRRRSKKARRRGH